MSQRSYSPFSQISFTGLPDRNDLHEMSLDDIEHECQRLREENHQLQLRMLGVNELARLLQDRSEMVQVLEEKNKRLEVAVVRLENRCANYDRTLKSQKGANVPTAKPGQSPFIPGPSRQILEGLMKENSELKKTVNNLSGKGAAGYVEAVKATQLEEVIDHQKEEIEFLKDQINQLTSTAGLINEPMKGEGIKDSGVSEGLSSLPGFVSDSGPLKRQLIQMQRAMKVKDRFCTLLSQQVTQLQNRLSSLEPTDSDDQTSGDTTSSTEGASQTQTPATDGDSAYKKLYDEVKDTLSKEISERTILSDKMKAVEKRLKDKEKEIDILEQRCEELTCYQQTLLLEKTELTRKLEDIQSQTNVESQMSSLSLSGVSRVQSELTAKTNEVRDLRAQLEEANFRTAIANSKLNDIEDRHAQKFKEFQNMIDSKDEEITALNDKIKDLEEDMSCQKSEMEEKLRDVLDQRRSKRTNVQAISGHQLRDINIGAGMSARDVGSSSLYGTSSYGDDITVKDNVAQSPHRPEIAATGPGPRGFIPRGQNGTSSTQQQPQHGSVVTSQPSQPGTNKHPTNLVLNSNQQQPYDGRISPGPQTKHNQIQQQQQQQTPAGLSHPGVLPSQQQQQQQPPYGTNTPVTPMATFQPAQSGYTQASITQAPPSGYMGQLSHGGVMGGGGGGVGSGPLGMGMTGSSSGGVGQSGVGNQQMFGQQRATRPHSGPISSPSPTPMPQSILAGSGLRSNTTHLGYINQPQMGSHQNMHSTGGIPLSNTAHFMPGYSGHVTGGGAGPMMGQSNTSGLYRSGMSTIGGSRFPVGRGHGAGAGTPVFGGSQSNTPAHLMYSGGSMGQGTTYGSPSSTQPNLYTTYNTSPSQHYTRSPSSEISSGYSSFSSSGNFGIGSQPLPGNSYEQRSTSPRQGYDPSSQGGSPLPPGGPSSHGGPNANGGFNRHNQ